MKTFLITIMVLCLSFPNLYSQSFIDTQKRYPRVRQAIAEKGELIKSLLKDNSIEPESLNIYIRAFKKEKKLELWAKNKNDSGYNMLKEYNICRTSGNEGPKRKQGDLQIPEGFYHIDRFNPSSNFHLSLGINYPNQSDRILGEKGNLGGDIFIHGSCVTIGCLPITDDKIKELYLFCVMAKNSGQNKIPVTIFPTKMEGSEYQTLRRKHRLNADILGLWSDLENAYDSFEETAILPKVTFLENGRHQVYTP